MLITGYNVIAMTLKTHQQLLVKMRKTTVKSYLFQSFKAFFDSF